MMSTDRPQLTAKGLSWALANADTMTARLALDLYDAPAAHIAAAIRIANEQGEKGEQA